MPDDILPDPIETDPLSDALHAMRMEGVLYCRSELRAPWGIEIPPLEDLTGFVAVTTGRALFEMDGIPPRWLERGSLTLIPHGRAHRLSHAPGAAIHRLDELPVRHVTDTYETLSIGATGPATQATYGVVRFDSPVARRLLAQLPQAIFHPHWDIETDGWMDSTLRYISREAASLKPGGETVLTRLADILVIQAIRSWLDHAPEARQGWLGALRDARIGRALAAIHRQPEADWTVVALAREAALSRSVFSARFTEAVGQSAGSYLAHWRLGLAHSMLKETDLTLGDIAERVGYGSEPAFGRAFRRVYGMAPGRMRQVLRRGSTEAAEPG